MKVNMKCVKNMCALILLALMGGCQGNESDILIDGYPELYQAVLERDAGMIQSFSEHPMPEVRTQSWRAMANTPVDDIDSFIHDVRRSNEFAAWMALSRKELQTAQLETLYLDWQARPNARDGICRVFGMQGDDETLGFLFSHFEDLKGAGYELECALAIGRLYGELGLDAQNEADIIRYAVSIDNQKISRAYLYGYYRNGQEIQEENQDLYAVIRDAYVNSQSPEFQQYILRMGIQLEGEAFLEVIDVQGLKDMNPQLAIELIQQSQELDWNDKLVTIYRHLIQHENPVVNEVALANLAEKEEKPESFNEFIVEHIVQNEEKDVSIRLSGLLALEYPSDYEDLTRELAKAGDYLVIKELAVYRKVLDPQEYFDQIRAKTNSENRREVLFAVQALNGWWPSLDEVTQGQVGEEKVRELVFNILERGDRSITYSASALLNSPSIIRDSDYTRFEGLLSKFSLPEDIEVYQSISQVLINRFEQQAQTLIDSLAKVGLPALNESLRQQGWEIPETPLEPVTFLEPDWVRLTELGLNPVWVLETTKGTVRIRMNVLQAPVTITGMDSLITNGLYNDVAFHRVVPNFVVQGGDVETGDGFGGPDYVVPTEASEEHYWRGKVGIASAGTDTEGSQYFIMHQWKPHLNAGYTLVGEVVEGMDVVDRLLVGDKVLNSYWSK